MSDLMWSDDETTVVDHEPVILLTRRRWPIVIEARPDHVLVVRGPYGGKGRTVAEAMDALRKRSPK